MDDTFKKIYEKEIAYVWNCLKRLGVADRDLEDKAHDVFVTFYRRLDDYDATRPVRPWLGGIAARIALDHHRLAYKKRELLSDSLGALPMYHSPDDTLVQKDHRDMIMTALDTLNLEQRSVFVLHDIQGYAVPEIAEMIDVPINTLYSRLRLARSQFTVSVRRLRMKKGEP